MGKHFAFVLPPAFGHVNPALPLVEELVGRGHRVSFVTGSDHVAGAVRAGAVPVELPWQMNTTVEFTFGSLVQMIDGFFDQAAAVFPLLVGRFTADPVDVVCFDPMACLGPALADKLDVPAVQLVPSMAVNHSFDSSKLWLPKDFDPNHPDLLRLTEKMAAFAAEQQLRIPVLPLWSPPVGLNLVFVPSTFQLHADTFDDTYRFLGPALGSRAQSVDWQPPADGSPVLFISLGTSFNDRPEFFAACVEAFADSQWHVVMAVGPAQVSEVPGNFDVRPSFPQPAVLSHAKVFVSHTGMNSTMESLYSGVPIVSVPQIGEQAVNGDRVQELGLGLRLDTESVTADVLRKAVDEVAHDPEIRAAVDRYSRELRAVDAAAAGADALLAFLAVL